MKAFAKAHSVCGLAVNCAACNGGGSFAPPTESDPDDPPFGRNFNPGESGDSLLNSTYPEYRTSSDNQVVDASTTAILPVVGAHLRVNQRNPGRLWLDLNSMTWISISTMAE